jgi:hypothetical protein
MASADGLFEYGSTIERYPGRCWNPPKATGRTFEAPAKALGVAPGHVSVG